MDIQVLEIINTFVVGAGTVWVTWLMTRYTNSKKIRFRSISIPGIMEWHTQCLEAMTRYRQNPRLKDKDIFLGEFYQLVERGRMFFKNQDIDKYNVEAPLAYRGYRDLTLTFLVFFQNIILQSAQVRMDHAEDLRELQRLFTSRVYEYTNDYQGEFKYIHFDKWYPDQKQEQKALFLRICPYIHDDRMRKHITDNYEARNARLRYQKGKKSKKNA